MLYQADEALRDDRLTTPTNDSAYDYFSDILRQDPTHHVAQRGMERIVDRYLVLVRRAIEAREWDRAKTLIDRARYVDTDHVGIPALEAQFETLRAAPERVLELDAAALRQRGGYLGARIRAFGRFARRDNARVTISVPNDPTGRWVYGQLDESPGSRRIRANIVIAKPYRIVVTTLEP